MNARGMWYSFALLLLAPLLAGLAAEKDLYGDPLPEGAKARAGTARMRVNTFSSPLLAPDGASLYAQSGGGLARLDPATGVERSKVPNQAYVPHEFSSDGKRAMYRGYESINVWDTESGKTLTKVERRIPSSDAAATISGDGKTLVLGGSADRAKKEVVTLLVWDVDKSKEISKITVPQNDYASVAVSRDGEVVASWGSFIDPNPKGEPDTENNPTRFVNFWNAADGKELSKFRASGYMPAGVALNNDGSVAAVAGGNSSIDLVDPKTGASKQLLLGRNRIGRAISFSPDGSTVAAATDDGTVQTWKVADGSRLSTTEPPAANIYSIRVQMLNNEKGVASATKGSTVVVWEVPSGKLISPAGGHSGTIRGVAITPDNKHFVTSAEDGTMLKWELDTGKPAGAVAFRTPYPGFGTSYQSATFNPNFTHALLRDYNGLSVFDIATLTQQYVIPSPSDGFTVSTFSPDGSQVIVSTSSYEPKKRPARVSVWNVAASKRVAQLELPGISNVGAAVTPDGKHIVTASRKPADKGNGDFFVTAWDAATGTKKGEYREEAGYGVPFITAAPDNRTAVVVTPKGALASFDLATGKLARPLELKGRQPGLAPVFSADGKKLAVVCQADFGGRQTATILVYDWETGKVKHTFAATGGAPACATFSRDGKWLITGSPDTTATVWDVSQ